MQDRPRLAGHLEAAADLRLIVAGLPVLDEAGFRLLQGLGMTGCLMDAGRMAGVPYRTAWDRLRQTAKAWGEPVVETASGGTRGGSSRVTAAGEQVLSIYTSLRREHERCLHSLNQQLEREWNRPLRAEARLGKGIT